LAQKQKQPSSSRRLGVWLFGAYGGLATTVVVGARAIARGLAGPLGLATESDAAAGIAWRPLDRIVFGGHEIRAGDFASEAAEIDAKTGSLPAALTAPLRRDLASLSRNVVPGVMPNAGSTIEGLADAPRRASASLRAQLARVRADLQAFQQKHRLERVVCVNLTSTEPALRMGTAHRSLAAFDRALDQNKTAAVRPSVIYAYAAASLGMPFVHFTPSNSALIPAVQELFAKNGTPFMGRDGKTGETLVKSAVAPMFRYRNLRVLSWQGYNILGDRDGRVLADRRNKQAKVDSKDALLPSILGYPLHTHVGIDFVPSLHDMKTAWDFVHFEGFLGARMTLQFTWSGSDSALAAPLVIDLVRWAELALRRGEAGEMAHTASYFKAPLAGGTHDFHQQFARLLEYAARAAR
jgi:myo-inositol-1-phosphate synthase